MKHSLKWEIIWISGLIILGVGFGILAIYFWGTPSVDNISTVFTIRFNDFTFIMFTYCAVKYVFHFSFCYRPTSFLNEGLG